MSRYPSQPRALNFTSKRVRIDGQVNGAPVSDITLDTATDVPCLAAAFVGSHPILRPSSIQPVPPNAISLRSAQGADMNVQGYIQFTLTLGDTTLPVEGL